MIKISVAIPDEPKKLYFITMLANEDRHLFDDVIEKQVKEIMDILPKLIEQHLILSRFESLIVYVKHQQYEYNFRIYDMKKIKSI